ncbi:S phase cyclin A-associated protein in the endoplasmic reticulum, partial [Galemys pyrenaicus]
NAAVDCKLTPSTTRDKHFDKSPTKTRHPRKIDLRARYWAFLFDNLRRAVDEIYVTCESDQSVVECKWVFSPLPLPLSPFNLERAAVSLVIQVPHAWGSDFPVLLPSNGNGFCTAVATAVAATGARWLLTPPLLKQAWAKAPSTLTLGTAGEAGCRAALRLCQGGRIPKVRDLTRQACSASSDVCICAGLPMSRLFIIVLISLRFRASGFLAHGEVLMMLDNYVRDFKALIDWIQLQEKLEKTDAQSR